MTLQNKKIFTLTLLVLIGFVCAAQGGIPPAPAPPQGPPPDPIGLPIDGGVLIAAFFAVVYGVKKITKSN